MKCKYRVKRVREFYRKGSNTVFITQKRLFGFLWFYNFLNIDGSITGVFDTKEKAVDVINSSRLISRGIKYYNL